MSYLKYHPVGQPVPNTPHAVCCSLPTMRDVIGYEEKHAATMAAVRLGYPRFVQHAYVKQAIDHASSKFGFSNKAVYALSSERAAYAFREYVQPQHFEHRAERDFHLVVVELQSHARQRAQAFTQHTGLAISSRQAEDYLVAEGLLSSPFAEDCLDTEAEPYAKTALGAYIDSDVIELCNSGMNAFYASFKAVQRLQGAKGRTVYVQLGWLYVDTQRVLDQFLREDDTVVTLLDVFDTAKIEAVFAQYAGKIAAVITELPTNPLMQTIDVEWLSELCVRAGAVRIFDPTMSSVCNVNLLPFTDVLVTSLTKYAAHGGDVMCGAYALNPNSSFYDTLKGSIKQEAQAPYDRDLKRLAWHVQRMPEVVAGINTTTIQLADYLHKHKAVKHVHWALSEFSAHNFAKIARGEHRPGGVITIELNGPLAPFYDASTVVKGPSFGTHFTMMCPFMYLAHYDWVSQGSRRHALQRLGLNPELVRISVGTEPIDAIIAAFAL